MPLDPVIRSAAAVVLEDLRVVRRADVELVALENHALEPEDGWAVGIARNVGISVMAAMHSHPLLGHRSGAEPQPEAKEMPQHRVEDQPAVSLVAVQIQRDREKQDLDGGE